MFPEVMGAWWMGVFGGGGGGGRDPIKGNCST